MSIVDRLFHVHRGGYIRRPTRFKIPTTARYVTGCVSSLRSPSCRSIRYDSILFAIYIIQVRVYIYIYIRSPKKPINILVC